MGNGQNCFTCERRNKRLEEDNGACRACAADDKPKGPFSRHKERAK
jgi:hypothetical protein